MKRGASIESILQPLMSTQSQAYLNNVLQVADVLDWILQQFGKSEVWQSTFSISEEFLRRLFFIEKSGLVSEFNLILDLKATNKTLKLWPFISQVIDKAYLADNHSKLLLVKAENGSVATVVTSQNLTRGNRYESGFISTEPALFNSLLASVEDIIKNHSVPLNDLFADRIRED